MCPLSLPVLEMHQAFTVRPLPCRRPCIVVHVVHTATRVPTDLPARWQWRGLLPVRGPGDVVDIVPTAVRIKANLPASGQWLVIAAGLRRLQLLVPGVGHWRWITRAAIWYRLLWLERVVIVIGTYAGRAQDYSTAGRLIRRRGGGGRGRARVKTHGGRS